MICARPCVLLQYMPMVSKSAQEDSYTSSLKRYRLSSSLYITIEDRAVDLSRAIVCEAKSRRRVNV